VLSVLDRGTLVCSRRYRSRVIVSCHYDDRLLVVSELCRAHPVRRDVDSDSEGGCERRVRTSVMAEMLSLLLLLLLLLQRRKE
jgi:hypothetical protein